MPQHFGDFWHCLGLHGIALGQGGVLQPPQQQVTHISDLGEELVGTLVMTWPKGLSQLSDTTGKT